MSTPPTQTSAKGISKSGLYCDWKKLEEPVVNKLRARLGKGYAGLMFEELQKYSLERIAKRLPSDYLPILAECLGPEEIFGTYLGRPTVWTIVNLPEEYASASPADDDKQIGRNIISAGMFLGVIEECLAPAIQRGDEGSNTKIPVQKALAQVEKLIPHLIYLAATLTGDAIYGYWSRLMLRGLPVKHNDLAEAVNCQRTDLSRWKSDEKKGGGMPARMVAKLCSQGKAAFFTEEQPFVACRVLNPFLHAVGYRLRGQGGEMTDAALTNTFWRIEKHRSNMLDNLREATKITSFNAEKLDEKERKKLLPSVRELIYELTKLEYLLRGTAKARAKD